MGQQKLKVRCKVVIESRKVHRIACAVGCSLICALIKSFESIQASYVAYVVCKLNVINHFKYFPVSKNKTKGFYSVLCY